MTATDLPVEEDMLAITEQIWVSLLGEELVALPVEGTRVDDREEGRTAWITIDGPVPMVVSAATSDEVATALARHLLLVDAPSADDVSDALGELVNVLGGNVKSLLPGPSSLTLPTADLPLDLPAGAHHHGGLRALWDGSAIHIDTWTLPQDPSSSEGNLS